MFSSIPIEVSSSKFKLSASAISEIFEKKEVSAGLLNPSGQKVDMQFTVRKELCQKEIFILYASIREQCFTIQRQYTV